MELSALHRRLFVELGIQIALGTIKANGFPKAIGIYVDGFHHSSISTWEASFEFLRDTGIFRIDEHGLHRLDIQRADLRMHLENYSNELDNESQLKLAVEIFVDIFVGALKLLPATRQIHQLPEEFLGVFLVFEKLDYVRRVTNGWEWTRSIEPAMRAAFIDLVDDEEG